VLGALRNAVISIRESIGMKKKVIDTLTNTKLILSVVLGVVAVLAVLTGWHLKAKGYIAKFETVAHADIMREEISTDLAMVSQEFRDFATDSLLRRYKDEVYDLEDEYNTIDPLEIDNLRDRKRYRYLLDEIEKLETDIDIN
jgi:hypothetical protein